MSYKIVFGTDGWRGVIAENYTFDNVRRCAQGFAHYLRSKGYHDEWVVVGYDKRFHSENFAQAAAEVLCGNGFRVYLTDKATPTPVISYAVIDRKAVGAINITASHNPPTDNGFKVRDSSGGAIDPEGLKQIESAIPDEVNAVKRIPAAEAELQGRLVRFDPAPAYIDHLHTLIDMQPIRDAGLKIVVDAMWGNGAGWFPRLLSGGKTQIVEIHNIRNPIFPEMKRPEPIPPNIDVGLRTTVEQGADVLVVTDGDADRVGIGDENGHFVNQLQVYGLLAFYLLEVRGERGPIIKTLSTTSMLEKLGELYGVPVYETGVGFKYVAPKFLETNALIGGEESGGYAFRGNVPERDGILAGLYFLDMMVRLNRKPSQLLELLFSKVGPHYYDRVDKQFSGDRKTREAMILNANPQTIGGLKVVGLNTLDGYKFLLEDGGWMLIRFSGTEPIIRVYCETTHPDRVQPILQDGLRIAGLA
ncbi:phosphoglucomutase/phosphomannomutase family protein [Thermanaerothrix sp. 4228-RoL]|uniref:Phosphoglucomutase/phosphomannomutase family protein n=1 Tax=Thermanaerothrix solaris TaxID=3058434 RepID=A0ABU3NK43_9CHLR|nr:phosphoglucomutase/phosphomannomutase family protein [Thermanaerothrix sp. 4228-RoL]MDT8897223.1 phosphoglucomutase/phosphomannomutase family protein [Thermanaerothrix sp. 4228-RoL]